MIDNVIIYTCLSRIYILKLFTTLFFSREIGTIIRSLGCCPTEGELHDFIAEVGRWLRKCHLAESRTPCN